MECLCSWKEEFSPSCARVKLSLSQINACKLFGPYNIHCYALRDCAEVFTGKHLQHLAEPGCRPYLLQGNHCNPSAKEVSPCLLKLRPSSGAHTNHHKVVIKHQVGPPPSLPQTNHLTDDICSLYSPPCSHHPSGQQRLKCLNADFISSFDTIIQQQLFNKPDWLQLKILYGN